MEVKQVALLALIIFTFQNLYSKTDSTYFQIRDSILASFNIEEKILTEDFLTANLSGEFVSFQLPKEISTCHNPILKTFQIENKFNRRELELLKQKPDANFIDSVNFLNDNDIVSNLFHVKIYDNGKFIELNKIGTDININFPLVIEKNYFALNKLVMSENLECRERIGLYLLHLFYEDDSERSSTTIIYNNGKTEIIHDNEK